MSAQHYSTISQPMYPRTPNSTLPHVSSSPPVLKSLDRYEIKTPWVSHGLMCVITVVNTVYFPSLTGVHSREPSPVTAPVTGHPTNTLSDRSPLP